jgi:hypothetical protein
MAPSRNDQARNDQAVDRAEDRSSADASTTADDRLYFFPDKGVDEARVRALLRRGSLEEKAWVVSHLLRYAQWDDIWGYVDREEVCAIFEHLDLPDSLRTAWARMLKIEVPVA